MSTDYLVLTKKCAYNSQYNVKGSLHMHLKWHNRIVKMKSKWQKNLTAIQRFLLVGKRTCKLLFNESVRTFCSLHS